MDPALRRAWIEIVSCDDYERHMANIGQAQAGAELMCEILGGAGLAAGARVVIAGAGTGQALDFTGPAALRPFRLTFADLNPAFLARLKERLARHRLAAEILVDDIEQTAIEPAPDLLLATLLLEHVDWRRAVEVIAGLRPGACGIVIQENPEGMTSAVTPGRQVPPTIAIAMETAHPALVPRQDLIAAFASRGYRHHNTWVRDVADAKRLVALLLLRREPPAGTAVDG